MNDFIDIYCERLGPGFWAEPVNALSNVSFFIAAFLVYVLTRRENAVNRQSIILMVLLLCIGTGSFLFHTLATEKAQLADVLPILFYQVAFLLFYSLRVMNVPIQATRSLMIMFFLSIVVTQQIPDTVLNGSVAYFPALYFLARFAVWHWNNAKREKAALLWATGAFILSLTFRSLDMELCPQIPLGLHFIWHLLNGFVLYMTARAYILNARS